MYEDIERKSLQYNTKGRKEVASIVRSDYCKPFRVLSNQLLKGTHVSNIAALIKHATEVAQREGEIVPCI